MTGGNADEQDPPRTLLDASEALARIRPARQAQLATWLAFHQRSAAVYAEVAEIDRGHHHEALCLAERERELAAGIETKICERREAVIDEDEDSGNDGDARPAEDVDAGP